MSNIFEEKQKASPVDLSAIPDPDMPDKELCYQKAKGVMEKLGYNTVQEVVVDLMIEGFYNKEENTWTEITDPTDIQTNRNHMNLAQAKYYGLKIIRVGEFIDNSNVKFA